jgi:hypothetical protein
MQQSKIRKIGKDGQHFLKLHWLRLLPIREFFDFGKSSAHKMDRAIPPLDI